MDNKYKKAVDIVNDAENSISDCFFNINKVYNYNQFKVLKAFIDSKVSESHFVESTGYGYNDIGLASHSWVAGDYPRVGILSVGDTITTNCLQHSFANNDALFAALEAYATTPVYVVPVAGDPVPMLTTTKPNSGAYGVVTKFYTIPNGDKGVKYQIVKL